MYGIRERQLGVEDVVRLVELVALTDGEVQYEDRVATIDCCQGVTVDA